MVLFNLAMPPFFPNHSARLRVSLQVPGCHVLFVLVASNVQPRLTNDGLICNILISQDIPHSTNVLNVGLARNQHSSHHFTRDGLPTMVYNNHSGAIHATLASGSGGTIY